MAVHENNEIHYTHDSRPSKVTLQPINEKQRVLSNPSRVAPYENQEMELNMANQKYMMG